MTTKLALGLMSGTSMDAIDVALIETDGASYVRPLRATERPWREGERRTMSQASAQLRQANGRLNDGTALATAIDLVTAAHISAVECSLEKWNMWPGQIDCIGLHGQTLFHRPKDRITVQIGRAGDLAARFRVPVIHDFRSADVAAGGEGAPLIPVYHRAMAQQLGVGLPLAVVNIGGVANLSYIDEEVLIGFDTGPGNGPMDDWIVAKGGGRFDKNGALAATGNVAETLIADWLSHKYFAAPWPKSLDRNTFDFSGLDTLSDADGAATLTAFTAATIARGLAICPTPVRQLVVTGGGVHNQSLMSALSARCGVPVCPLAAFGWNADALEAEGFGYLAVRRLRGLPATFPATTGVSAPMLAGEIVLPDGLSL